MSDSANTAAASGTIRAPWEVYSPSMIAEPSPAPACTTTSWSCSTSSRTPAGVSATRYSSVLISVGTPTFTCRSSLSLADQLAPAEGQPEVDAIARGVQRPARQLLDAPDPVAQRVAMTVQLAGGALPLAVAFDERLQRAHQLAAVRALALLDRREDRVAEQPQRLVVLEREQQLERAEVAIGREPRGRPVVGGQAACLERAARLVERAPQLTGRDHPAGAGRQVGADLGADAPAQALGEREHLLVAPAARRGHEHARELTGPGGQAGRRLVAQCARQRVLGGGLQRPRRREHDHRGPVAQAERLQAAGQLRAVELAGDHPADDVARKPPLGVVGDAAAQQLE